MDINNEKEMVMRTVLIVDDEENIRFSFGSILTDAGFSIFTAANIYEAKIILDSTLLDVAIVDRLLESDDGMTLVEYVNKVQSNCTVVFVSAFPTFQSAAQGIGHQIFAYLEKPVRKLQLCKTIEEAARNSQKKQLLSEQEKQLIQAQKMTTLGMLISGVVHDFNNLFMIIPGYIDLSMIDLPQTSPVADKLERIRQVSIRGKKLSEKLLSYIKQENTNPEKVQIQSLVREAVAFLRIMIPKAITITETFGYDEGVVLADPVRFEQIIMNIGINAMHAMQNRPGTIDVATAYVDLDAATKKSLQMDKTECVKISISDTGCGMDQDTLNHIFDPFFSTRPQGLGTGIGLSTTLNILKDHGGGITAHSQPGKGSSFHIYLPILNSSKHQQASTQSSII